MPFKIVQQTSATDLVLDQILQTIRDGEFCPGDRLPPERNLAQMLGVSRPTLREAIAALAILDVLEIRQGAGTFVKTNAIDENLAYKAATLLRSEKSHLHALEMLLLVEPEIASLAAQRAEDSDLQQMRATLAAIEKRAESQTTFKQSGMDFHLALIRSIDNPVVEHSCLVPLAVYYEGIPAWWEVIKAKMKRPGRLAAYSENYRAVYQAIAKGDSSAAREAMRAHLLQVQADLLQS